METPKQSPNILSRACAVGCPLVRACVDYGIMPANLANEALQAEGIISVSTNDGPVNDVCCRSVEAQTAMHEYAVGATEVRPEQSNNSPYPNAYKAGVEARIARMLPPKTWAL